MNVPARGKIHDGVGAPFGGPTHFFDFFLNAGGDSRVADVGIDLHQEVTADNHRLTLRVVDICGNDCSASCYFSAHELRGDLLGNICTEFLTPQLALVWPA